MDTDLPIPIYLISNYLRSRAWFIMDKRLRIKENDKRNIGFNIKSNNIFVPKITLSINDYTRFCENFK